MRRLRNSTWRGAHNAPHCGTDSVPGRRSLGRNPSHGHLYRRRQSESTRLFPANGAALNVSQVHSARRHPLIESSCSARHKGETASKQACPLSLSRTHFSAPLTSCSDEYINPWLSSPPLQCPLCNQNFIGVLLSFTECPLPKST